MQAKSRHPTWWIAVDVLAGCAFGLVVLHPISMAIVGHSAEAAHGGVTGHAMPFDLLHVVASPMAAYFATLGAAIGALSGCFRIKLKAKNRDLEAALMEKESLLRILTHDLANSIAASQVFLGVGLEGAGAGLTADTRDDFESASKSLAQARELMDFTRKLLAIESGKMHIQPVACDVGLLVQESLGLISQQCMAKQLSIAASTPIGRYQALVEPVVFKSSIINNLLSNAVKFSPPGERIRVEITGDEELVSISVTNTGATIAAERLSKLFSPTGRTATTGTAGERGTGFGLPLAHRLCKAMGGELRVTTREAGVAGLSVNTFSVLLPALEVDCRTAVVACGSTDLAQNMAEAERHCGAMRGMVQRELERADNTDQHGGAMSGRMSGGECHD